MTLYACAATNFASFVCDYLIVPVVQDLVQENAILLELNSRLNNALMSRLADREFIGKESEVSVIDTIGYLPAKQILVVGLGKEISEGVVRAAAGDIARIVSKGKVIGWVIDRGQYASLQHTVESVVEGLELGGYTFDRFKSEPKEKPDSTEKTVTFIFGDAISESQLTPSIYRGKLVGNASNIARDLANRPPNDLTPSRFVEDAKKLLEMHPVTIEVLTQAQARELGMGAFLCVAQGSASEAFLLIIRHRPQGDTPPIALVGKGVTFDSGGISIKPGKGMSEMKADMSGAAAVLGAFYAVASLNVPINLTAIIPLTENMPSGSASRPGDIVTAMNGKTIEIINTDAEGRLILCDAISYAVSHEKASQIVDIATLTGASSVALGDLAGAVLGNDQSLIDSLITAGNASDEWVWQLPLYDGYFEYLKSDVADMMNASELGKAGTCTGAKFLEQFVEDTPWAHLDIASIMKSSKTSGCQVKGMRGAGARLLIRWILAKVS